MERTSLRGIALLRDPRLNKSTAFTEAERDLLGLTGLVPEGIDSEDVQIQRVLMELARRPSNLDKYLHLSALQDTNETLFYRVVMSDPARFLPLVYTPTVGDACLEFSHIVPSAKGLYLSIKRKGRVREILHNWPQRDVRFIVVTSGERILGLGDLGANGMGISIGKLVLYTAGAGVPPQFTMPIALDCGTNNEALLKDPLYLGLRRRRPTPAELDEFVDEFVTAVQAEFPNCCIQFEDWARADAFRLLARYQDRICCFNDDIQGSGAVVLAGMLSALRISGGTLREQKFLLLGAGSAGIGIARMLTKGMTLDGLAPEQARARIWLFNRNGLIQSARKDLTDYQKPYAHDHDATGNFVEAIESIEPTAIIGVSTMAKAFDQHVIEAMTRINARPIVLSLSNPTSHSECTAEEAYQWSDGRAIFASGSPFPPVQHGDQVLVPGQCNNVYVFPAIGLALYASRATRVTDEMFTAAAQAIADEVTEADLAAGLIYPPLTALLKTEIRVAQRIAQIIFARHLAGNEPPADLEAWIDSQVYRPRYPALISQ